MRFLGLGLGDAVPDANTIWTFREALTQAGAIERLFELFERELRSAGYSPCPGNWSARASSQRRRSGQAPCRRTGRPGRPSAARRTAMRAGPSRRPRPHRASARRRWSIWRSRSSVTRTTDRRHRLIRRWLVTAAAAYGRGQPGRSVGRTLSTRRAPLPPLLHRLRPPGSTAEVPIRSLLTPLQRTIPSILASLSPFGCRPSRIASTTFGARQMSRSSRQT
jgi:hypothetical protein